MPYQTTTLSSVGTSSAVSVNWRGGKPWTAQIVTASSSGTGDFTFQYTLQDLTSSQIGLTAPTWQNATPMNFGGAFVSSAITSSAGFLAVHFESSTITPDGVVWISNSPVAGLRISSTALSSTTLTLTFLQGEGW